MEVAVRFGACVLAVLLAGCGAGADRAGEAPGGAVVELTARAQVEGLLGQKVRVVGEAQNAKLAAHVQGQGISVYCAGLSGWPDEVVGKQVVVTGVLRRNADVVAKVDESGAVSQGTMSPVLMLEAPDWALE